MCKQLKFEYYSSDSWFEKNCLINDITISKSNYFGGKSKFFHCFQILNIVLVKKLYYNTIYVSNIKLLMRYYGNLYYSISNYLPNNLKNKMEIFKVQSFQKISTKKKMLRRALIWLWKWIITELFRKSANETNFHSQISII